MTLEDETARYYAELSPVYDKTAGYMNLEAEELRIPIKKRFQEILRGKSVLEIACGTGYWTAVIGETAGSVLATDISSSQISIARERCRHLPNVSFRVADAYTLEDVPAGFDAAFAHWWWSHIPRGSIGTFLNILHCKLNPGSLVLFRDLLPRYIFGIPRDVNGNNVEQRELPDGRLIDVVKNYPPEEEILAALDGLAEDIKYIEYPDENSWDVIYRTL